MKAAASKGPIRAWRGPDLVGAKNMFRGAVSKAFRPDRASGLEVSASRDAAQLRQCKIVVPLARHVGAKRVKRKGRAVARSAAALLFLFTTGCAGPFNQVTPCIVNCAVTLTGNPATAPQPASVMVTERK